MTRGGDKIQLGAIMTTLITAGVIAGAVATTGVAVLAWRADASDRKVADIEKRQRNLVTIQAGMARDVEWTSQMVRMMLKDRGLDVPPRPKIEIPKEE